MGKCLHRELTERRSEAAGQCAQKSEKRRAHEQPEHGTGIVLDMRVAKLSGDEVVPDVRGEAALVDIERCVAQIARKAREPDDEREHAHEKERDVECMRADDLAPLVVFPVSRRDVKQMERRQSHRELPRPGKRVPKHTDQRQHERNRGCGRQNREYPAQHRHDVTSRQRPDPSSEIPQSVNFSLPGGRTRGSPARNLANIGEFASGLRQRSCNCPLAHS